MRKTCFRLSAAVAQGMTHFRSFYSGHVGCLGIPQRSRQKPETTTRCTRDKSTLHAEIRGYARHISVASRSCFNACQRRCLLALGTAPQSPCSLISLLHGLACGQPWGLARNISAACTRSSRLISPSPFRAPASKHGLSRPCLPSQIRLGSLWCTAGALHCLQMRPSVSVTLGRSTMKDA